MSGLRINLCLSGGGTRGFAHLGIVKALHEAGIEIGNISGASSGALAGSFIAAGYSPDECMRIFHDQRLRSLMNGAFRFGLLTLEKNTAKFMRTYLPENFEELKLNLFINATDILKGECIYFNKGNLIGPLLGSASVPAVFRPVAFNEHLLVDGGMLNNLPVEPLRAFPDALVAVHVNPVGIINTPPSAWAIIERSFHLSVYSNVEERKRSGCILIEPPALKNFRVFSFKKAEQIFEAGYDYTKSCITEITEKIEKWE